MFKQNRLPARMAPLLVGLSLAGAAMTTMAAGQAGPTEAITDGAAAAPFSCEIETVSARGAITLEGVVRADQEVSGSYRFTVSSAGRAGSAEISQGGGFTAGPGGAARLGKVVLGDASALYEARLHITANGKTFQCAERVNPV